MVIGKSSRRDVVVVGAGLAGLAAARALTAQGLDVVVVEARNRVGGRTLNLELSDGQPVEIGGQWVGPTQERVLALIDELGLETFMTYDDGDKLFEHGGRRSRYRGAVPRVGPLALADVAQTQLRLDRMARAVAPERPWEARQAEAWDCQTFATWGSAKRPDPDWARFLDPGLRGGLGSRPGRRLAAALPLLHQLGRRDRRPDRDRRGCAGTSCRRRLSADLPEARRRPR